MKLNELKDNDGARKSRMRVGRGIGSGKGKTSGRGVKGQTSRTGVAIKGFEGGQMPIHRRLPKRGFTNIHREAYETVNTGDIERSIERGTLDAKKPINVDTLKASSLVRKNAKQVKLLAKGKLSKAVTIEVDTASKAAVEMVNNNGGQVTLLQAKQ